jgi:hypothetical protein
MIDTKNTTMNLRDLSTILQENISELTWDEFQTLKQNIELEYKKRTKIIIDSLPNEIWAIVFRYASCNDDIDVVSGLRLVSSVWFKCYGMAIDEATIFTCTSFKRLGSIRLLRSLIVTVPVDFEIQRNVLGCVLWESI